jgi:hypothetical protein
MFDMFICRENQLPHPNLETTNNGAGQSRRYLPHGAALGGLKQRPGVQFANQFQCMCSTENNMILQVRVGPNRNVWGGGYMSGDNAAQGTIED